MDGTAALAIQVAVTVAGFAGFAWKVGRRDGIWGQKLDALSQGQQDIRVNMVAQPEYLAHLAARDQHFKTVEDRLDDLEGISVLPREIDAMQSAYREALGSLAGSMDKRFSALEQGQKRLQEQVLHLSDQVDRWGDGGPMLSANRR